MEVGSDMQIASCGFLLWVLGGLKFRGAGFSV